MTENKGFNEPTYEETVTWGEGDLITLTYTEKWPTSNPDGTYRDKPAVNSQTVEGVADELTSALNLWKAQMKKEITDKLDSALKARKKLGQKPLRTSEMIRLEENLRKLGLSKEIDRMDGQIQELLKRERFEKMKIAAREASIASRPKTILEESNK